MTRPISANLATEIAKSFGVEPLTIIEIQWVENGQLTSYADRDIGNIPGRIVDVSNLDFVINISERSDSAEVSIILSDIDGDLKNIIDHNDIHKRDVWIYQTVEGLDSVDKSLVFRGEINSPITWNEGDRTLKFQVISKIEDAEIGFSIEEGQFVTPSPELIGKPWPLKFGTTINVPALRFTTPTKGVLSTGIGISDFTLPFRIEAAENIICPLVFRGYKTRYGGATGFSLIITPVYTVDENCALNRCETIDNLKKQLEEQQKYEFAKIVIIDGEKFPQGTQITLDIDGGKFTGVFQGTLENPSNVFLVTSRKHPEQDEIGIPTVSSVRELLDNKFVEHLESGCTHLTGGTDDGFGGISGNVTDQQDPSRKLVEASAQSWEFYNAVPTSRFFWANPGATVTLDTGEPIVYVTNLLPETIHSVAAFRNFDAGRRLVTVPKSFYTVRFADFASYTTTEVVLDKPLSRIADGWDDDLYITSTSTVGPNTVNILEWLIQKYTDLGIDSTSFNEVRNILQVYPSDFPILERKNILTVLEEIAFQARCAIYLRDGVFFLKYLPQKPSAEDTITASDVDTNTLEIFHSDTENIVTKLVADWRRDYSLQDSNKLILRHNIKKYGTQEEVFDFYIYNQLDYIHKSATFWLIRKSNTWRKAKFSTPIHKLKLETFDGIDLNINHYSPNTIRALITKADYNSDERRLDFEIWAPVKSGTLVEYDFAWPADIDEELFWPTLNERDSGFLGSGDAPGFLTVAPAGHPLSGDLGLFQGFTFTSCESQSSQSTRRNFVIPETDFTPFTSPDINMGIAACGSGNGDTFPSDIGDNVLNQDLERGLPPDSPVDPGEINVGPPNLRNLGGLEDDLQRQLNHIQISAANAEAVANAANEAAGGQGSGSQPLPENPFKALPPPNDCATVRVVLRRPTIVARADGGISFTPGVSGRFGSGVHERTDVIAFASCCEGVQLVQAILAQHAERQAAFSYTNGGGPYPTSATITCDPGCELASCEEQDRDEEGNPTGKLPTPTGYEEELINPSENPGDPTDYWNGEGGEDDLTDKFDKSLCADPDCPPPEEDDIEIIPGTPLNPAAP